MARKMTEWPSKRGPITKIMPSDGCKGGYSSLGGGPVVRFPRIWMSSGKYRLSMMRALILTVLVLSGCQNAYVAGLAGPQWWPDTSNGDEVEAGSEAGWVAGGAAGYRWTFEQWLLRLEGEAAHRRNNVHGRNDQGRASADENMDVTSVLVNVWPEFPISETVGVYVGGGIGGARVDTFGEDDYGLAHQVGLGFTIDLDLWSLDLGYRYFAVSQTDHDGAEANYDSRGPVLKVIYNF